MRTIAAVVLTLAAAQVQPAKPDFSGNWVLAEDRSSQTVRGSVVVAVMGLLGEKFTATQNEKTLKLVITALGREVTAVYNLDGSESKNLNPQGPGIADEAIFSRVSWDANKLVIHTRGTTVLLNGKPIESRRVMWIDADGLLTIERTSEGAPTTRSVYRRLDPDLWTLGPLDDNRHRLEPISSPSPPPPSYDHARQIQPGQPSCPRGRSRGRDFTCRAGLVRRPIAVAGAPLEPAAAGRSARSDRPADPA